MINSTAIKDETGQSTIWLKVRFASLHFFLTISVLKREQLLILPFFSFLCKVLPLTTLAARSPNIVRTCKIFQWNFSILASESAGKGGNLHQLKVTNDKHLAVRCSLRVQLLRGNLQVEWIVQ